MLSSSIIPNEYHEATKHSVLSVQLDPNYVDASTQPSVFKKYPKFFRRFPLDLSRSIDQFLSLTSAITFQKQYRETIHALRVQPSAGALYPTELYVQLRHIPGWLDGIYHLEPDRSCLTLIYELIDDGLEGYFSDTRMITGCIFLMSCVYFRSSWKYKNRSLRYCFLDSGHHLGAVEAAAQVRNSAYQLQFDFDQLALNEDLGFEHQEFTTAAVIVGEPKEKPVRRLRLPLAFVPGTDYFEPNRLIEAGYKQTLSATPQPQPLDQPEFLFEPARFLQSIQRRRSARRFDPSPIRNDAFQTIQAVLQQPIPSEYPIAFHIYAVVHRVMGMEPGVYRLGQARGDQADLPSKQTDLAKPGLNPPRLHYLKSGHFCEQTQHLCINQAIARDSAVVFFVVSRRHGVQDYNYRVALQQAGFVGQRLYLAATYLNLGCSGIGAFYDDETQAFLETDQDILYALAVGQIHERDRIN